MTKHLKDILSSSGKTVDPKKLMAYLNNELTSQEAQAIEEILAAGEFEKDALEGLEAVSNKKELDAITHHLNRELQKKIKKSNRKKKRSGINQTPMTLAVILIFLFLIIMAYWMITRLL